MPNLDDNQKQPVQTQNDWTDSLLLKDKTGKFHHLNSEKVDQVAPKTVVAPVDSNTRAKISSSPLNDNFVPVEHGISSRFDDKAVFAFHPEDEEQAQIIAQQIPQDDSKKYSVDKIVDKLVEKQGLKFDNENKEKFIDILYQFFRSRRKAPIVREILSTKILSGGKKISAEIVDNILSVVKGIKSKIDAEGGLVVMKNALPPIEEPKAQPTFSLPPIEEPKVEVVKDEFEAVEENLEVDKEIQKALSEIDKIDGNKEPEPEKIEDTETELKVKVEPRIQPPVEKKIEPDIPPKQEIKETIPKSEESSSDDKVFASLPKVIRPGQTPVVKKQIIDVVAKKVAPIEAPAILPESLKPEVKHVLSGPVQELQDISVKNFRRLGDSAQARADKILEKINILEQESYTKKSQAIEAWRKSGVYKIYLQIGAQSMIEGKKIEDLVKEKESKGEETLSAEEFSVISDLNKKLRF
ncbi:hypothetical protein C4566_01785 [Candidatus Parcubacteria bacterium]|nr:MAG: hypothetical protein C4566_01785 [Candidatus Parcubacteria bacterium]